MAKNKLFTVKTEDTDSFARTGVLQLPHGSVETPAFMPVGTNGTVKAIHLDDLDSMNINMILANTYHLFLRPGIDVIRASGGLHSFISWPKNILTDSGGFQVFSLSRLQKINETGVQFQSHIDGSYHEFSPEIVIDLQKEFGSDICMPLDVCTPPGISHEKAGQAVAITTDWLRRSKQRWEHQTGTWDGKLFGIIQGNFFDDLRKQSTKEILDLDLPGIAIGGLSVGEPFEKFLRILDLTATQLPLDKPHYLMGVGTPDYRLESVSRGIDIFDCVFPTRTARNGMVFTRNGTINLKKEYNRMSMEPIDPDCGCPVCARYSRAYLRHLFKAREILGIMLATRHNLDFIEALMRNIRKNIKEGSFCEFKRQFFSTYDTRS